MAQNSVSDKDEQAKARERKLISILGEIHKYEDELATLKHDFFAWVEGSEYLYTEEVLTRLYIIRDRMRRLDSANTAYRNA